MSEKSEIKVCVVGMGFVGATLAVALAKTDCVVFGVEKDPKTVSNLQSGRASFYEPGIDEQISELIEEKKLLCLSTLGETPPCDYYIITVGTPLDEKGRININPLEEAVNEISSHMQANAVVVVRSTVKLGVTEKIVRPILVRSNKKFYLSMCPERTIEGNALSELGTLPQIVGAPDAKSRKISAKLFELIAPKAVEVNSCEAAELTKLISNSFRDISFGFANEVALMCDKIGVNAREVLGAAGYKYPRARIASPGLVGGPCLEKDPHILIQSYENFKFSPKIVGAARSVNEEIVDITTDFVINLLENSFSERNFKIVLAGLAFKGEPQTDDLRGSLSIKIVDALRFKLNVCELTVFDPVVSANKLRGCFPDVRIVEKLEHACVGCNALIICNNHKVLKAANLSSLMSAAKEGAFVYDYWDLHGRNPEASGVNYYSFGNSQGVLQSD